MVVRKLATKTVKILCAMLVGANLVHAQVGVPGLGSVTPITGSIGSILGGGIGEDIGDVGDTVDSLVNGFSSGNGDGGDGSAVFNGYLDAMVEENQRAYSPEKTVSGVLSSGQDGYNGVEGSFLNQANPCSGGSCAKDGEVKAIKPGGRELPLQATQTKPLGMWASATRSAHVKTLKESTFNSPLVVQAVTMRLTEGAVGEGVDAVTTQALAMAGNNISSQSARREAAAEYDGLSVFNRQLDFCINEQKLKGMSEFDASVYCSGDVSIPTTSVNGGPKYNFSHDPSPFGTQDIISLWQIIVGEENDNGGSLLSPGELGSIFGDHLFHLSGGRGMTRTISPTLLPAALHEQYGDEFMRSWFAILNRSSWCDKNRKIPEGTDLRTLLKPISLPGVPVTQGVVKALEFGLPEFAVRGISCEEAFAAANINEATSTPERQREIVREIVYISKLSAKVKFYMVALLAEQIVNTSTAGMGSKSGLSDMALKLVYRTAGRNDLMNAVNESAAALKARLQEIESAYNARLEAHLAKVRRTFQSTTDSRNSPTTPGNITKSQGAS